MILARTHLDDRDLIGNVSFHGEIVFRKNIRFRDRHVLCNKMAYPHYKRCSCYHMACVAMSFVSQTRIHDRIIIWSMSSRRLQIIQYWDATNSVIDFPNQRFLHQEGPVELFRDLLS